MGLVEYEIGVRGERCAQRLARNLQRAFDAQVHQSARPGVLVYGFLDLDSVSPYFLDMLEEGVRVSGILGDTHFAIL